MPNVVDNDERITRYAIVTMNSFEPTSKSINELNFCNENKE